jgi:methionyl-tRNA formyltransferase
MRFAIATIDRYQGVFEAFLRQGWKPLKLFTAPAKNSLSSQASVIARAEELKAAIQLSRMTEQDLKDLKDQGCEALIVASYDWKIDDWRPYLRYAVNFHPSPLPEGRGPYPIIRAMLEKRASWGVTCHRLVPEIDQGEILAIDTFQLGADECHERMDLKVQMSANRLADKVASRFQELWDKAVPQSGGSYWKKPTLPERLIDFGAPVENIMLLIRAFGASESYAKISGVWVGVTRAVGWVEPHMYETGKIVHVYNNFMVVTARNGYIGILESDLAPPPLVEDIEAELAQTAPESGASGKRGASCP